MKLATVPIEQAVGAVLIHNIADAQGHKALNKGHRLVPGDVEKLRSLGKTSVFVGVFEHGDVFENDAATRIANAVAGKNLTQSAVSGGRINLSAAVTGVLAVNREALDRINSVDGITVATVAANQVVTAKKMVATIKTIGLALPFLALERVEQIAAASGGIISVRALSKARVAVIFSSSDEARDRVEKSLTPPIQGRVEELGASIISIECVNHTEDTIAAAISRAQAQQVDCVIIAGETSIMDASDVTPQAIVQSGGKIEVYGAPVEPGNLLLLAYAGELPIIGAPGCVKSRDINVVDLILPRLLAGERVSKRDIVALANGGLLI
jgi:molybdopterin biosynthesis enzyme